MSNIKYQIMCWIWLKTVELVAKYYIISIEIDNRWLHSVSLHSCKRTIWIWKIDIWLCKKVESQNWIIFRINMFIINSAKMLSRISYRTLVVDQYLANAKAIQKIQSFNIDKNRSPSPCFMSSSWCVFFSFWFEYFSNSEWMRDKENPFLYIVNHTEWDAFKWVNRLNVMQIGTHTLC